MFNNVTDMVNWQASQVWACNCTGACTRDGRGCPAAPRDPRRERAHLPELPPGFGLIVTDHPELVRRPAPERHVPKPKSRRH